MAERAWEAVEALGALRPAVETLVVGQLANAARFSRLESLWYASWDAAEQLLATGGEGRPRRLCVIGQDPGAQSLATLERARLAYHQAAAAGLTAGVLVWRYRSWPGEANGLATTEGAVAANAVSVIRFLTHRATEWGTLLAGARLVTDAPAILESQRLRCAVYERGGRRVVLIHNQDAERFARGTLRVPAMLAGRPVGRLVAHEAGTRYIRGEAPLTIPLHVPPAGALLFDVY